MKAVIVDNGGQFTHLEGRALRDIGVEHSMVNNTIPPSEAIDDDVDCVIISGGPSIDDKGYSHEYIDTELPVLGICLGHQIIAEHFGGAVGKGQHGGYADIEVELLEDTGLFRGLGTRISTWSSHSDEVKELPSGFIKTARSDVCEIEAMRHESKKIYGVQWHPEVSQTEKGLDLLRNFMELAKN